MKTRKEQKDELLEFIKFNFENLNEYLKGLNKVGVKEQLHLFGIDIQYYCNLNINELRSILNMCLKEYKDNGIVDE